MGSQRKSARFFLLVKPGAGPQIHPSSFSKRTWAPLREILCLCKRGPNKYNLGLMYLNLSDSVFDEDTCIFENGPPAALQRFVSTVVLTFGARRPRRLKKKGLRDFPPSAATLHSQCDGCAASSLSDCSLHAVALTGRGWKPSARSSSTICNPSLKEFTLLVFYQGDVCCLSVKPTKKMPALYFAQATLCQLVQRAAHSLYNCWSTQTSVRADVKFKVNIRREVSHTAVSASAWKATPSSWYPLRN